MEADWHRADEDFSEVLSKFQKRPAGAMRHKSYDTPLGTMFAVADNEALVLLEFADEQRLERQLAGLAKVLESGLAEGDNAILMQLGLELDAYFAGLLREFTVPIQLIGTEFQVSVWERLREIPYGKTRSYGDIAAELGGPDLARAVGSANGDNRIAIVVPCHRVIGSDGSLTGYAGGLSRKQRLLEMEAGVFQPALFG